MEFLKKHPCCTCSDATKVHILHLANHCKCTLTLRTHVSYNAHKPYFCRPSSRVDEVDEVGMQHMLSGNFNTEVLPSPSLCPKT